MAMAPAATAQSRIRSALISESFPREVWKMIDEDLICSVVKKGERRSNDILQRASFLIAFIFRGVFILQKDYTSARTIEMFELNSCVFKTFACDVCVCVTLLVFPFLSSSFPSIPMDSCEKRLELTGHEKFNGHLSFILSISFFFISIFLIL